MRKGVYPHKNIPPNLIYYKIYDIIYIEERRKGKNRARNPANSVAGKHSTCNYI